MTVILVVLLNLWLNSYSTYFLCRRRRRELNFTSLDWIKSLLNFNTVWTAYFKKSAKKKTMDLIGNSSGSYLKTLLDSESRPCSIIVYGRFPWLYTWRESWLPRTYVVQPIQKCKYTIVWIFRRLLTSTKEISFKIKLIKFLQIQIVPHYCSSSRRTSNYYDLNWVTNLPVETKTVLVSA